MSRHPDKFRHARHAGFTLVEALVSLTLLTSALVPAFILATDALRLSAGIRNTLIAANLAQEGVEVVRSLRDANWFAGKPFDAGLDVCDTGCRVSWDSSLLAGSKNNDLPLLWDKNTGLYQYTTGTDSPFIRNITITKGPGGINLVVKSQVSWIERSTPKSIVVEEYLYDWIK